MCQTRFHNNHSRTAAPYQSRAHAFSCATAFDNVGNRSEKTRHARYLLQRFRQFLFYLQIFALSEFSWAGGTFEVFLCRAERSHVDLVNVQLLFSVSRLKLLHIPIYLQMILASISSMTSGALESL